MRFAYRLALATGRVNVRRMLRDELEWRDLVEWAAFAQLEPFGHPAQKFAQEKLEFKLAQMVASVVQALYNIFTRKKGEPAQPLSRYVLKFSDDPVGPAPTRTQTMQQQKNILMAIARAYATKG